MPHKKINPDWSNKGYKYWAKPMESFPQYAHDQARLMMEMWNRAVEFFHQETKKRADFCRERNLEILELEEACKILHEKVDAAYQEFKDIKIKNSKVNKELVEETKRVMIDPLQKEMWALEKKIREARKETCKKFKYKSDVNETGFLYNLRKTYYSEYGLTSYDAENIRASFTTTLHNFYQGISKPPRFKKENRLFFMCQYPLGRGFEELTKKHNKRTIFWIDPPGRKGRTDFHWRFGDEVVTFRSIIHRPIPEEALIKSVRISQNRVTGKWSLIFALSMPPVTLPHCDKIFYFFPKWSVDGPSHDLIVGKLFTESGGEITQKNIHLFQDFEGTNKSKKLFLPLIETVEKFRSMADQAIEEMKQEIAPLIPKLKDFGWNGNLALCRIEGIKEIQKVFRDNLPCHPLNDILYEGIKKYYRYLHNSVGIDRRIRKFRNDCYWNFVNRLAKQAKIVYLNDIDLKNLGEVKEISEITEKVESKIRKYKSYAAHYDLFSKIKKKCAEHGVEIKEKRFKEKDIFSKQVEVG